MGAAPLNLPSQVSGPHEASILSPLGQDDRNLRTSTSGGDLSVEDLTCWRQENVPRLRQATGDDNDLGVQNCAEIRQTAPQVPGEVVVALQGGRVPLAGGGGNGLALNV